MKQYRGLPASGGTALATAVVACVAQGGPPPETLEEAAEQCRAQVRTLHDKALAEVGAESAEIFSAYEALLSDPYLLEPIHALHGQGVPLSQAVERSLEQQAAVFLRAKSPYLRERAEDLRSIKQMLLRRLSGSALELTMPKGGGPVIVAAESLSPADTMALDKKCLAGFVTRTGGVTSHVVILAKNLGIPAVTGLAEWEEIPDGAPLLLDGDTGVVTVEPDEKTLAWAEERRREQEAFEAVLRELPPEETLTRDGRRLHVSVNVGGAQDLEGLELAGLDGVGLYRTEFLFVERSRAPGVREQEEEYAKVFDALEGRELIVRTLDIGGDKEVPYLALPKEDNPFLGCRGIRLCLRREELMREQFEALMRASRGRDFSVMFPMVNTVKEFLRARSVWEEVRDVLSAQGIPVSGNIKLGVMVETPAAMICADALAGHVDFASIGTNDLTQYILAADRGNPDTGVEQSVYAPAVVRAVCHIIRTFAARGVKVSVCGEAGSDPQFLPLMLGMGLRHVSVSRSMVDRVRYAAVRTHCGEAERLLEQVLGMTDEADIRRALGAGGQEV